MFKQRAYNFTKLKDKRGFTLIELMVVFVILGILAQMALVFFLDLTSRAHDLTAMADGRNVLTMVRDNFVSLEDVDYTAVDGSQIGVETMGGESRDPVFIMSPGVEVRVNGGFSGVPDSGWFWGYFYHTGGTVNTDTPSGRKEFLFVIDELGVDTIAGF